MCRWARNAYQAAMEGTQEIGLAVLATTLSIVAVFLPIGFMGGIIGKFFHEFGLTIVAAVLISMFVSFTLDPMLLQRLERPGHPPPQARPSCHAHAVRQDAWAHHRLVRARHRAAWAQGYQGILRWALRRHSSPRVVQSRVGISARQRLAWSPLLGTEFVPKADFSETSVNFYTPVGSISGDQPRRGPGRSKPSCASCQRCATPSPPSTAAPRRARCTRASTSAWWTASSAAAASMQLSSVAAPAAGQRTWHHRHPCGPAGLDRGGKQIQFSLLGTDTRELERRSACRRWKKSAAYPAWSTWTPASSPTSPPWTCNCGPTRPPTWA